jgi:hypothetical protein
VVLVVLLAPALLEEMVEQILVRVAEVVETMLLVVLVVLE